MLDKDKFYSGIGAAENSEAETVNLHWHSFLGECLKGLKQVACQSVVLIRFGNMEVQLIIEALNFGTTRYFVISLRKTTESKAFAVVFIFYLAEDFFHEVFKGDESGCATEFVYDNGHGAFLGEHTLHEAVGEPCLGGEDDRFEACAPVYVGIKQLGDVNIAYNIIYIGTEDHNLAESRTYEGAYQFMAGGCLQIHCYNFVAGGHALPYLCVLEVESILENFHLVLHFVLMRVAVYGLLYVVVDLLESQLLRVGLLLFYSKNVHESFRKHGCEPRQRIEGPVYQPQRKGEKPHGEVGVDAEDSLREKLARYEYDESGYDGVEDEKQCF